MEQLLVRREDREAGELELGRQGAGGWHALTGAEQSLKDRSPKSVVHLAVERRGRPTIDRNEREKLGAWTGSHAAVERNGRVGSQTGARVAIGIW